MQWEDFQALCRISLPEKYKPHFHCSTVINGIMSREQVGFLFSPDNEDVALMAELFDLLPPQQIVCGTEELKKYMEAKMDCRVDYVYGWWEQNVFLLMLLVPDYIEPIKRLPPRQPRKVVPK